MYKYVGYNVYVCTYVYVLVGGGYQGPITAKSNAPGGGVKRIPSHYSESDYFFYFYLLSGLVTQ